MNFVENIAKLLVLDGKFLFELMDYFLARLNKDTAGLVNVIDFMDGRTSTVFSNKRSRFEPQVPTNRIQIKETAKNIEISEFNVNLVISNTAHRVKKSNTILRKLSFFEILP